MKQKTSLAALGTLWALGAWGATARADDWLAALPECAAGSATPSAGPAGAGPASAALEYPRPGLPAIVNAGQRLVARVRLPVPLTPPPGIQQSRALREYSAELHAQTPALEPAASGASAASGAGARNEGARRKDAPSHRYRLEVIAVRPEGASSLRYRVTIPVPAWAAPGIYTLRLVAAGVALPSEAQVVVLAQSAAARLRPLPAEVSASETSLPAGARAPVDVWLRTPSGAALEAGEESTRTSYLGAPVLDTEGLVAALRVGEAGLWVLSDCATAHLPFADQVTAVLGVERRTRLASPAYAPEVAAPALQLQTSSRPDGGFELRAQSSQAIELSFVLGADGRPLHASAGALELYPATELPPPERVPLLIARWRLLGPAAARLERSARKAAPTAVALELVPSPLPSGRPLRVRARRRDPAGGPAPLLALRFDERSTAFGYAEASHRFTALGPARVRALWILPDATAVARIEKVQVVTEAAIGCSVARPSGRGADAGGTALGLSAALWLLKRRPRRPGGNRLGARSRSPDQPRRRPEPEPS